VTSFVFLHGGAQGSWVWDETVAALKLQSDARTFALDVPGCGAKRGRDTSNISFDQIADELVADIEDAQLSEPILVGHSQAGTMLPRILERIPHAFARVVYVSCVAPRAGLAVAQFKDEAPTLDPAPIATAAGGRDFFCNDMSDSDAVSFMAKLGQDMWPMSSYAASDWRYDHLGAPPASYFLCMKDQALAPLWQEHFAQRFRAARIVRFDAAHQLMNTRPHALAEALLQEARL
jgi:pimeloyl-ACP methyl ester carboxylesterase